MSTKIQLRGISRTPSDKMSAEGGLAESLNFRIDNGESTPMVPATDLTSQAATFTAVGLPPASANLSYDVLYLHKQNNYEHFICSQNAGGTPPLGGGTNIGIWTNPSADTYTLSAFLTLPAGESIKEVTAIGNTVVVYTDVSSYYAIYREGEYTLLGSKIPSPAVRFISNSSGVTRNYLIGKCQQAPTEVQYSNSDGWLIFPMYTNVARKTEDQIKNNIPTSVIKEYMGFFKAANTDKILAPVFMRSAIRLFDGNYVNQSAPYCVGAGQNYSTDIFVFEYSPSANTYNYYLCMRVNPTIPRVRLYNKAELEKWEDIIRSVDVFATERVINPNISTEASVTTAVDRLVAWDGGWDVIMEGQYAALSEIEEFATGKNVFRMVLTASKNQSIYDGDYGTTWDAMSAAGSPWANDGVRIDYPQSGEQFEMRDALPDDYDSNNTMLADNAIVFNQRLILSGVKQRLSSGNTWFGASVYSTNYADNPKNCEFKYFVTADSADSIERVISSGDAFSVIGKDFNGTQVFGTGMHESIYGWVAFPHPNCKKVIMGLASPVSATEYSFAEIEMKQHPKLSCSYAFFGFGETLFTQGSSVSGMTQTQFNDANPYLAYPNKMVYSEADNPFTFPVAYRRTFDEDVITCRVANKPLSQGETGKFPLYVFTKGGIYVMETTSLGTFLPPTNVSRDVALSADSVKSIDRAVVFTTAKGVMLISGGEISCLSSEMNGRHYTLETQAQTILNRDTNAWKKYLPILTDSTPFMAFMQDALYAYDYAGQRIICFNASKPYAYVYSLSSSTWHKLAMPDGLLPQKPLNTYPETYVSMIQDEPYWHIGAIPNDSGKRTAVVDLILDDCDVDYSEQELDALLRRGEVVIADSDVLSGSFGRDLDDYQAEYEILDSTHMMDYSTFLDEQSDTPISGVIVTRPFDLGAPDVRKTLKDLRIRGQINRQDVQYMLFGSMDGIHFSLLASLRGVSCKLFRLVLLTSMTQAEKISYIEAEFETKFTNKLR